MGANFFVGVESFKDLIEYDCTYIDKTGYLKDLFGERKYCPSIDSDTTVSIFLRPRRTGKTLTLSMIDYFCRLDYKNPSNQDKAAALFKNLEIYKDKEFCRRHMAQYPVMYLTFVHCFADNFRGALFEVKNAISSLYSWHNYAIKNEKEDIDAIYKKFQALDIFDVNDRNAVSDIIRIFGDSLRCLCELLYKVYGRKCIVLIDEYDVPLKNAAVHGYYDEMAPVMKAMFLNVLKDNEYLERAFLTGSMRAFKESEFSDLNNIAYYDVNDETYNTFIGLTKDDVAFFIEGSAIESRFDEICRWYGGYNFAGADMMSPITASRFIVGALCSSSPATFWCESYLTHSTDNPVLDRLFCLNNENDSLLFQKFIDTKAITISAPETLTYYEAWQRGSFSDLMMILLHRGYVTAIKKEPGTLTVKMPNNEVFEVYKDRADRQFCRYNEKWYEEGLALKDALLSGDIIKAQSSIRRMLLNFISVKDYGVESSCFDFISSVLSMYKNQYLKVQTQNESEDGYYVISMKDRKTDTYFFIETTDVPYDAKDKGIEQKVRKALSLIDIKDYVAEAVEDGYNIVKYGIVFYGKGCYIVKG